MTYIWWSIHDSQSWIKLFRPYTSVSLQKTEPGNNSYNILANTASHIVWLRSFSILKNYVFLSSLYMKRLWTQLRPCRSESSLREATIIQHWWLSQWHLSYKYCDSTISNTKNVHLHIRVARTQDSTIRHPQFHTQKQHNPLSYSLWSKFND